ncbi:peptidoglycan-binding domain-containing protein [Pseudooceanicola nanhaiensis]|uniref:peptidoglycan-binding domain-containing protein n=1 Tax=Pseudooceanicola nanhaiensis TaxID=375761 RepID=UPI001CD645C5|nr:peptidoglycan-binding domain-containing protein [Pseudooceanicola nanhaiensis]MCA0921491.1 peptidoglycan-binding protein [Pseudooceanicola nanhaiensis]
MRHTLFAAVLVGLPGLAAPVAAPAADLALVIVNGDYDTLPDLRYRSLGEAYSKALEEAGFRVFLGQDAPGGQMQTLASDLATALEEEPQNRLVIVLAGHMARAGDQAWLLGREAQRASNLTVGAQGLPVGALGDLAMQAQGQAVMLLAEGSGSFETGSGLIPGAGEIVAPQGVTLARGDLGDLLDLLRGEVLIPGLSYQAMAERAPRRVEMSGFLSPAFGLMPGDGTQPALPGTGGPMIGERPLPETDMGELAYWAAVEDIGTIDAYEAYVSRYPRGKFEAEARARAADIRDAPVRRAEEVEAALDLSRDDRRQIQRDLALLGHDPRGIDGLFGPATRSAIISRQKQTGAEPTGYLTAPQLDRLAADAQAEAARLEAEAARRRAAQEAEDRAYWDQVGRGGEESGLRAYLERYPDGLYADEAQKQLDRMEEDRRGQAQEIERRAWDFARNEDTAEAYRNYLRFYPRGLFADAAETRIAQLEREAGPNREALLAEENSVMPNDIARLLVERRLQQLGHYPGLPDGKFDPETRRAIRRFQRDQSLEVTGFLNQETVVRLLAVGR